MTSWRDPKRHDEPPAETIHGRFERLARESPGRVAVSLTSGDLEYGQLNRLANRTARRLRGLGAGPGSRIGLCMERSRELIVTILAILKSGAAYVPLDPDYPDDRLAYMASEAGLSLIAAHGPTKGRAEALSTAPGRLIVDLDGGPMDVEDGSDLVGGSCADDLAYVMFTSGSTGRPKGVMVGHRAVVRLVRGEDYCRFGEDEVFLQLAPASFDASTFEIWGPLLNGGRLAVMPPGPPTLDAIAAAVARHGVTTLWLTSGLFNLVIEQRPEIVGGLRQLLAGGDVLSPPHVLKALRTMVDGALINGYGPTEGTTFSCCHRMRPGDPVQGPIPIGRPVAGATAHILDEALCPVPDGSVGELWIGGERLAHGYLNDPSMTSEKFIPDPFGETPGGRLYRTGDLARLGTSGAIDFLGRRDTQIKISGYRVEPGEVEAALGEHPGVGQAVVIAVGGASGEKRLVAYFVPKGGHPGSPLELRAFLSRSLPSQMIPSEFVELERLPLTPNGKLDRSALPASARPGPQAPEWPGLIGEVARLWVEALGRDVGLDDNFFDLGGDSLTLIGLHSSLQRLAGRPLSVVELFEHSTIRAIAGRLGERTAPGSTSRPLTDPERAGRRLAAMENFKRRKGARG